MNKTLYHAPQGSQQLKCTGRFLLEISNNTQNAILKKCKLFHAS